jgi:hypothetical protein
MVLGHWSLVIGHCPLLLSAFVALLLLACVSDKPPRKPFPSVTTGPVDQIQILAAPFAVDLDGLPGPDGIAVKFYALSAQQPGAVPVQSGTLEVFMYDGLVGEQPAFTNAPLHTWKLSAEQLKPFEVRSAVGAAYQLSLPWGKDRPTKSRVTVLARYTVADRPIRSSSTSVISVGK